MSKKHYQQNNAGFSSPPTGVGVREADEKRGLMVNKKAIIFTIDAILAILAALTLIAGSFYYLSQTQNIQWTEADRFQIAMNSLAVLELSNDLQNSVDSMTTTELNNYLNNILPMQVCGDIKIFAESQSQILSAIKTDCAASDYKAIAIRDVYVNGNLYTAHMGVWYK